MKSQVKTKTLVTNWAINNTHDYSTQKKAIVK